MKNYDEVEAILDELRRTKGQAGGDSFTANCLRLLDILEYNGSETAFTLPPQGDELRRMQLLSDTLQQVGYEARRKGEKEQALLYLQQALRIAERSEDTAYIVRRLCDVAMALNAFSDPASALEHLKKALVLAQSSNKPDAVSSVYLNLGIVYRGLSEFALAMEYYQHALEYCERQQDSERICTLLGNIAVVYGSLGDYEKALEYNNKALALAEQDENSAAIMNLLGNIGLTYHYREEHHAALEAMGKSLALAEERGDTINVARQMINRSSCYSDLLEYETSVELLFNALERLQSIGEHNLTALCYVNLGRIYTMPKFTGRNIATAEEYYRKAIDLFLEMGERQKVYECSFYLSELYEQQGRWEEFAVQYKRYHQMQNEVMSEEARRSAQRVEIAMKEREYEATRKLLHNVLPPTIATRLMQGERIAEAHPNVSVLFADIVNFTQLTQRIPPEKLIDGLDIIFTEFDLLAEKLGLEKIKTIGDAYMIVAGAPRPRADHATVITQMALGMMTIIQEAKAFSTDYPLQLRIGIHFGDVVAGVIGKNKYNYDLWGDAVNTASRMESHGEAGKIHVTEEFVQELSKGNGRLSVDNGQISIDSQQFTLEHSSLTIDNCPLTIIPRGFIDIKGKGLLRTFFLERVE